MYAGVNHVDVAVGDGDAARNVGPSVAHHRDHIFVAARTDQPDREGALAQLEQAQLALQVEDLDLFQVDIADLADLDARAAAVDAVLGARDEGLTRFVGLSGHDLGAPRAQLAALKRWELDTVMFPLSPRLWSDATYRDDVQALLGHCRIHDIGVQVLDAVSWRPWGDREPEYETWYEPHTDPALIRRGVDFALSTPGVHCIATPGDRRLLADVIAAADKPSFVSKSRRAEMIKEAAGEPLVFSPGDNARR